MTLNVVCVWWGPKYAIEYVSKLKNMVSKNLDFPFNFVCFTDHSDVAIEGVTFRKLPGGLVGWWNKLWLFSPEVGLDGDVLFLDLDIVIQSNINHYLEFGGAELVIIRDFNREFHPAHQAYNSSVMKWKLGHHHNVWKRFHENADYNQQRFNGDQDWIYRQVPDAIYWPDDWIISYKWEYPKRQTDKTSIIVFHGDPKPHELQNELVKKWQ